MEKESYRQSIIKFFRKVLLIELCIIAVVGLICWVKGWHTIYQFGTGMIWAGIAATFTGLISGINRRSTFQMYQMQSTLEDTQQGNKVKQIDKKQRLIFMLMALTAAAISFVTGSVVQTYFK